MGNAALVILGAAFPNKKIKKIGVKNYMKRYQNGKEKPKFTRTGTQILEEKITTDNVWTILAESVSEIRVLVREIRDLLEEEQQAIHLQEGTMDGSSKLGDFSDLEDEQEL